MCGGATSQQQQISQAQDAFYNELTSIYSQEFGQAEGIFKALKASFTPILKAGIGQQGFTPQEMAALNTQATEGVAQNYAAANKAVNEKMASLGGGNEFLPSGATAQINADIAQSAAQQRSAEQTQITEANYAQGRQNYLTAAGVLGGLPGVLSPTTAQAGVANEAGTAAANTANQIAQQNNSWMGLVGGVLGGAAQAGSAFLGNPAAF